MTTFLHTMVHVTDPARSRAFYEALGFESAAEMDIVRNGEKEATNYFFSLPGKHERARADLNHDGRTYDLGTGYGHIAIGVGDLDGTLAQLKGQGIEPERPPYTVRDGGSRLCFVRDPDGYRVEIIEPGLTRQGSDSQHRQSRTVGASTRSREGVSAMADSPERKTVDLSAYPDPRGDLPGACGSRGKGARTRDPQGSAAADRRHGCGAAGRAASARTARLRR